MVGVQEQRSPSGYNVPVWFSGGKKKKRLLNEYVFICSEFFSFPNKLPSAPLVRAEMIELKRYFSLQISLLMGAGRQESTAVIQWITKHLAEGRMQTCFLYVQCFLRSTEYTKHHFLCIQQTDIVGMSFMTANIFWQASTNEDIQYY